MSENDIHLYEAFARLLEYPRNDREETLCLCQQEIAQRSAGLIHEFIPFLNEMRLLSLSEAQELYTHTFDLNPVCTLDIGYHLFGENYKRGVFLAKLRETESQYGVPETGQLPDYLPVVLRLFGNLPSEDLRAEMVSECLLPALEKMLTSLKDKENPYSHLLNTIRSALYVEGCAGPLPCAGGNGRSSC